MKSIYTLLLSLFILLAVHQKLSANHAMAVDLTYACLDESEQTYSITLDFYFDCGSVIIQQPAPSVLINVFSSDCGEALEVELTRDINLSGEEVSQLCSTIIDNNESNCGNGTWPGVEKYVFEGTVKLPEKCEDWIFSYRLNELEFRSATITNLVSPELQKIYVQATLDNTQGCNSAPSFASIPVAYYCTQSATFTQGAIEVDGDDLDFTLIQPLNNLNNPIPYTNASTPTNPFPNNFFNFEEETGEIQFETNFAQFPVVAVLVEEYRNGKVIGSVVRDMQFVVLDCENQGVTATLLPEENSFSICATQNVQLDFEFTDADTEDEISVTARNIADFNGATFTQTPNAPNPATASFNWSPTIADAGLHILEIEVTDNRCPISSGLIYTYTIEVIGEPNTGPDLSYCESGSPLLVEIEGGGQFTWSPTTNLTFLNSENSLIEIRAEGAQGSAITYTVSNACNLSDELTVTVVQDVLMDFSEDVTVCQGNPATMFALPIIGDPSFYTYEWSPINDVDNPTAAAVIANPTESTTYSVSVRSNESGCIVFHDFNIGVSSFTSEVTVSADDTELCLGENTQLNAVGVFNEVLNCGVEADTEICNGQVSTLYELGEGEGSDVTYTPYHGDKKGNRLQILYKREDLAAIGMESGFINSIAFNVTNLISDGNVTYHEMSIKMGCTDVELITDFQLGLQEVYFANTFNTAEDWNIHEFFRAYKWDGVSNLLVEICYNDVSVPSGNAFFDQIAYTTVDYGCVFRAFSSSGGGCNLGIGPNINNGFKRPDIQFSVCPPQPASLPTITWTPSESLDNPNIANPIATPTETTTYTVTFDDNGCSGSEQITIEIPNTLDASIRPDTSICEAQNVQLYFEGSLPATATYSWMPIEGLDDPNSANPMANVTESSSYQVTISLNDACNSQIIESVNIEVGGLGNAATISPNATICEGENSPLEANGGTIYQWSSSQSLSCTDCPNPTANPTVSEVYQVTVSNDSGCSAILTTAIEIRTLEGASVNEGGAICAETSFELAASGGNTYEWSPTTDLSCNNCPNPEASPSMTTTYEVVITDDLGCSDTLETTIEVSDAPEITFITPDQSVVRGQELQLEVIGNFASVEWSSVEGMIDFSKPSSIIIVEENITFTVQVANEIGCITTAIVNIEVIDAPEPEPCVEIVIPSSFSPNDDGVNDKFLPVPESFDELQQFIVYNRWGKEVHNTTNPTEGWDGNWNFEAQPMGAYAYFIEATCGEEILRKQGWVMLIR